MSPIYVAMWQNEEWLTKSQTFRLLDIDYIDIDGEMEAIVYNLYMPQHIPSYTHLIQWNMISACDVVQLYQLFKLKPISEGYITFFLFFCFDLRLYGLVPTGKNGFFLAAETIFVSL